MNSSHSSKENQGNDGLSKDVGAATAPLPHLFSVRALRARVLSRCAGVGRETTNPETPC